MITLYYFAFVGITREELCTKANIYILFVMHEDRIQHCLRDE